MQNETALLQRLQHRYLSKRCLLINPPDLPGHYDDWLLAGVLHDNCSNHELWSNYTECPVWYGCQLPDQPPRHDMLVLFLPKGKQRLIAQLQLLQGRLSPDATLILIGANDAGIKSAGKVLRNYCTDVTKVDTARHCQAWSAQLSDSNTIGVNDLLNKWTLPQEQITFTLNKPISLFSLPGTFAAGKLDPGSALLLSTLVVQGDTLPNGAVLDFGCGSGLLSTALSQQLADNHFTAVDNDAFAVTACKHTFSHAGINGNVIPTASPEDINGTFDLIISNPPFHQGIATTTVVTAAFISQLPRLLKPNGQAWLVANAFLNYERPMKNSGLQFNTLEITSKFKLLHAYVNKY